jgi:large subunit ribosomal protein L24
MKIKTGDNVIVLTGKDKGRTGKVTKAFPQRDQVLIDGLNVKKHHQRATRQGGKGQIVDKSYPIHVSNVRKAEGDAVTPAPKKARAPKKTTKKSE